MPPGTKTPLLGTYVLTSDVTPARSPGILGLNDAANPDALVCEAGDTPGVAGTGGDAGEPACNETIMSCLVELPAIAIDLDEMRRVVYATAYAEAADLAATRGFASADVNLGEQKKIEATARNRADVLMAELHAAMQGGPTAVQSFVAEQERRKERARASLKKKLDDAIDAGRNWEKAFGWTVKSLSVLKFGSTVTVKVLSLFTGPGGTAIDFAYSGAQAGVDHLQKGSGETTLLGVVAEETGENVVQEIAGRINEFVADGIMTKAEADYFKGMLGNYKGNSAKLSEQIASLEDKLLKALKAEQGKKAAHLAKEHARKLSRLKELRLKTARGLMGKGASGVAKKAAGKTLSLIFLADEIKDAWGQMGAEWRASD
jgi:hypothetical protein